MKIQSETLRNSLLSSISHDLRTPLATILGAATALENEENRLTGESAKKLARTISHEARRMSDLMLKILDMARLESGSAANRQWYEAEEIIGSALYRLDKLLNKRPINIQIVNGHAPIFADAVLIQTLLVNLLDNACKYSPADSAIDIKVESRPLNTVIQIMDRGLGIAAGCEQQIFEKFFQMRPEGAQNGAGLGLSICRAIVQAHAGEIEAYNRHGGGAVFKVCLPCTGQPPVIEIEDNAGDYVENR